MIRIAAALGKLLFVFAVVLSALVIVLEGGCGSARKKPPSPPEWPCCPGEPCPEEP